METGGGVLTWRSMVATDLPLLARWLRNPQVARWWNREQHGWSRGQLVGLVQRSMISDYPQDLAESSALVDVPDGAVELD